MIQEVARGTGVASIAQPCYLWDKRRPVLHIESGRQEPEGSGLLGTPPAIPEQVHVK